MILITRYVFNIAVSRGVYVHIWCVSVNEVSLMCFRSNMVEIRISMFFCFVF